MLCKAVILSLVTEMCVGSNPMLGSHIVTISLQQGIYVNSTVIITVNRNDQGSLPQEHPFGQ